MKPVYVPRNPHEKVLQRALIQYRNPDNYELVMEALKKAGRMDLVGFGEKCLIRPRKFSKEKSAAKENGRNKAQVKKKKAIRNVHKKRTPKS